MTVISIGLQTALSIYGEQPQVGPDFYKKITSDEPSFKITLYIIR